MSSPQKTNRLLAIDGLRGVAALGVMVYHFTGHLQEALSAWLPDFVITFFRHGFLGVPIFFVLSGFVIALSVGKSDVTARYIGNFALRRSVRLDPTYWTAILIALFLIVVKIKIIGHPHPFPSWQNILAHMFYLQDLLRFPPVISSVFWTLAIEFQFYLFYVLVRGLGRLVSPNNYTLADLASFLVFSGAGVYSLFLDHKYAGANIPGLFLPYWHYFWFGVLVLRAYKAPEKKMAVWAWLALEIAVLLGARLKGYPIMGISAAMFIYFLGATGRFQTWLADPVFQYLGKISYTLYLLHADIGWKFISVCQKILGGNLSPFFSAAVFLAAIGVSIVSAHILHKLVEVPSLKWASRLKK